MAKRRIKRYARRRARSESRSRTPVIILCFVLFILLCLVASVAIGIALGNKADEAGNAPKYNFERFEYKRGDKTVRSVEAYFFPKGTSAADYSSQEISDFSFEIRGKDGTLNYSSSVGSEFGFDDMDSSQSLSDVVNDIHGAGGYACGYFYLTSFECADEALREVYKAYEIALIKEASRSGVDDILLIGLDVTASNIDEAEQFVARAATAAKTSAVGVMLSEQALLMTEDEVYFAARLKNACDYLAVDLTDVAYQDEVGKDESGKPLPSQLEVTVDRVHYFIDTYKVRVIFGRGRSNLYRQALEMGLVDMQVIDK